MKKKKEESVEEKPKEPKQPLWTRYQVHWHFPMNLCAQVPNNLELVDDWVNGRKSSVRPPNGKTIQEIQAEVAETLLNEPTDEELKSKVWLTFQRVDGGLVMGGRTVRAHFKDCGRVVGKSYVGKVQGESMLGWKVANGIYVEEYWIPILRNGEKVTDPDGYMDKTVRSMTRSGPISALKRFDYVCNVQMKFTLKVLAGLNQNDIETIMQYGAIHGYAGERSEGEGRYVYQIEKI